MVSNEQILSWLTPNFNRILHNQLLAALNGTGKVRIVIYKNVLILGKTSHNIQIGGMDIIGEINIGFPLCTYTWHVSICTQVPTFDQKG